MNKIKEQLDYYVDQYNRSSFIENDPISIPHRFTKQEDIEIMGFWTAMLSWGQRKTIINKSKELVQLMDNAPHDFIMNHEDTDLKKLLHFKHRTFNSTDTLYFIDYFRRYYQKNSTLETAFIDPEDPNNLRKGLIHFHKQFFDDPFAPQRTRKHVSTPIRKSACKRLNMFLRWMVRADDRGVDFGIWTNIKPSELMIPLDVHVFKVGQHLGILQRQKADWQAVEELTAVLRKFDNHDPVKYDYALFMMGIEGK